VQLVETKARSPRVAQWGLASLDGVFGSPAAAQVFVGELRQVRRYLREPSLKAAADARVASAIGADTRVLVGHSLGSVVAFEYLRQQPQQVIDLLVTVGSPLALRTIRSMMPDPQHGSESGLPGGAQRWVNVWDRHDPVACAGGLRRFWSGVEDDDTLDNGREPHSVGHYLAKAQTGRPIAQAVPELADGIAP
jgi:pimeloyl-ACP methyl ester carboxylesterase